jgi:putative ABC transport system permease protein
MRPADVIRVALQALTTQRKRTVLSLLGVAIGVAAVLVMTAMGEGARSFATDQFRSLGSDLVIVVPGRIETTGIPGFGGVPNDLTIEDAQALARAVTSARRIAPLSIGNDILESGEKSRTVLVMGSTHEMAAIRGLRMRAGAFLPEGEWDRGSNVAVLGSKLASELFPGESALGKSVRLAGWRLRVIGVAESRGTHLGVDLDESIFVPVASAMRMFDVASLFRIMVELVPGADAAAAKAAIRRTLFERHDEEDFTLITQDAVVGAVSNIMNVLTLALAGIAAVSLGVAGIGIMNVMLVSVAERTREIGLMKALGATPRQVLAVFVTEAALISGAGGAGGLALGELAVRIADWRLPTFDPRTPLWAAASAAALSITVGVVFGALPARRAMKLSPVAALSKR